MFSIDCDWSFVMCFAKLCRSCFRLLPFSSSSTRPCRQHIANHDLCRALFREPSIQHNHRDWTPVFLSRRVDSSEEEFLNEQRSSVVRISGMSDTSTRMNFGLEPSCGSLASAAVWFHPTRVMFAVGQCRAMARAMVWPMPDAPATTTTFSGDLNAERRRPFETLASWTVAYMFTLSFYCYSISMLATPIGRESRHGEKQFSYWSFSSFV